RQASITRAGRAWVSRSVVSWRDSWAATCRSRARSAPGRSLRFGCPPGSDRVGGAAFDREHEREGQASLLDDVEVLAQLALHLAIVESHVAAGPLGLEGGRVAEDAGAE